jgi:hypothetical protein
MDSKEDSKKHESKEEPFLYCKALSISLKENFAKTDYAKEYLGASYYIFQERHNNSWLDFKDLIKTATDDSLLLEFANKVFFEEGKKIDILYLILLGAYVNELIRDHYLVLLKPSTQQGINDLGEISEITFKNKEGKVVTTYNPELIKEIMASIDEPLRTKGQTLETWKIGKCDKMDDVVTKSVLQCKFAYYLAFFLKEYYPESKKKHRGRKGLVTPSEQLLIMRLMTYFGLYRTENFILIDNAYRTDSFRKMVELYQKLSFPSYDTSLLHGTLLPVTFIKYDDWKDKIDWFNPTAELSPIGEDEEISIIEGTRIW